MPQQQHYHLTLLEASCLNMTVNRNGVDQGAVSKRTVTAKGNLIVGTANSVVSNLAVGNDGEQIVADSSATVGLRYSATPSASNPVLNAAAQIWQRGTSFTGSTTAFCADRWQAYRNTTGSTFSRQVTGDTTNLPNIQYAIRAQRNSGDTATNGLNITQNFESANSIPFAGKTVTVSFYARAGANYSSASSIVFAQVFTGTGTDQNIYSGLTGQVTATNTNFTLTTTWQRFSTSFAIGATATQISMLFGYNPVGTAGANDYFDFTGVQLDIGSVALPFRTYAATIQGELAACQRYYTRWSADQNYSIFGAGMTISTTKGYFTLYCPVQMRTAPTAIDYASLVVQQDYTGTLYSLSAAVLEANLGGSKVQSVEFTSSGLTNTKNVRAVANNTTAAYVGLSAEL